MKQPYRSRNHRSENHLKRGFTFLGGRCDREAAPLEHRPHWHAEDDNPSKDAIFPLSCAQIGDLLWVAAVGSGRGHHSLRVGDELHVVSRTPSGSAAIEVNGQYLGLGCNQARSIAVSRHPTPTIDNTFPSQHLHDLKIGATGRVLSYDCPRRGYRKRLLAMGLTPGTEFTVTRHAPLGDPVEIYVRGFSLSLRKDEARALLVELVR
ncbi:ferrous iron transport protein A [Oxynema sp. CENA135]|uniref:FeoA family protein n=1 Tax=Oxynema sp. CENA135 TaxID=984206 RepID=UPI00190B3B91|nr:FeoA family protein [Oxynema sp. CENA135]MBK4730534.1 ferrous iron transport protein A [Oxynema sp. CENA135]